MAASLLLLLLSRVPSTPMLPETTTATRLAPPCPCLRLTELPMILSHTLLRLLDVVGLFLRFQTGSLDGLAVTSAPLLPPLIWPLASTTPGGSVRVLTACCAMSRLMGQATHGLARTLRLISRPRLSSFFLSTSSHNFCFERKIRQN
ncbi:hypothetical protein V8C42DRAFT_318238 [Trichoderma barbatum]